MEVYLLPVALTSFFVSGCLVIKALSRWPERVQAGLGVCLVAVVSLLFVEGVLQVAPQQSAHRSAEPVASATALYGGVRAARTAGDLE